MEEYFDVAIVGAGPAGSSLAFSLSKSGLSTILFDRENFPRNKLCGGGLPAKVLDILPFNIDHLIENKVDSIGLSWKLGNDFFKTYPKPLIYTVDRSKFDNFIVNLAKQAGTVFCDGEPATAFNFENNLFKISTIKRNISARVLVGADGSHSKVAEFLSLWPIDYSHIALQVEVSSELISRKRFGKTSILLDWGFLNDGYAWVFPKDEKALIGVQVPIKQGQKANSYLLDFLSYIGIDKKNVKVEGHLIPHRIRNNSISKENALLVGDAAGLADYWTGEGMYYALKSSQIASKHILSFLRGEVATMKGYDLEINSSIMPELRASRDFSNLFNHFGKITFVAIKKYDYAWDVLCRIMRGDRTFNEAKKRLRPDIFLRKLLKLVTNEK